MDTEIQPMLARPEDADRLNELLHEYAEEYIDENDRVHELKKLSSYTQNRDYMTYMVKEIPGRGNFASIGFAIVHLQPNGPKEKIVIYFDSGHPDYRKGKIVEESILAKILK